MLQIKKAQRKKLKFKGVIQGAQGAGKTLSALRLMYGLVGDWEKIVVIDTENESASFYANTRIGDLEIGEFNVISLAPPYTPELFVEAIQLAINAGMEGIIIDSLSHEWSGTGGILDLQQELGGQFQHWRQAKRVHNKVKDMILQAPVHIICTLRLKVDYVLEETINSKGRPVLSPKKVGLKPIQEDEIGYEFTTVWTLDHENTARVDKDRTRLFLGMEEPLTEEHGRMLKQFCESGADLPSVAEQRQQVINKLAQYANEHEEVMEWLKEKAAEKGKVQQWNIADLGKALAYVENLVAQKN